MAGNPLQYSCLENPMDRGAWWATIHEVAKNRTQLKLLTHRLFYVTVGSDIRNQNDAELIKS